MPKKKAIEKAKQALRKGKSPSTAAGEFIREEMERMGDGENGAGSPKQAIAIGLAKARRAGVPLAPQPESPAVARNRRAMERAYEAGRETSAASSPKRARTGTTRKRKSKSAAQRGPSRAATAASGRKRAAPRRARGKTATS